MSRKLRKGAAIFAALLMLIPAAHSGGEAGVGTPVIRCLSIGMDRFITQEDTGRCSGRNAEIMEKIFTAFLPEGARVTRRENGPGTAEELEKLIRDVFGGAAEEDVSFLYLSTHGVIWEEGENSEKTIHTALILSDGEQEEAIEPQDLREMLDVVPGKKAVILDACYSGSFLKSFGGNEYRIITSCGAEEESFFWTTEEGGGAGYFTTALESALRTSDPDQIDPDGNGWVSLGELAERTKEIYGAADARFQPEKDGNPLFLLPAERRDGARITGLIFGENEESGGQITVSFQFRAEEKVKLEYRIIPEGADGWDFRQEVRMPDREKTGRTRGLLTPGDKERQIRIPAQALGKRGRALLQILSSGGLRGQDTRPECTRVIEE